MSNHKIILPLITAVFLLGCKKEDEDPTPVNQAPDDFSVTVTLERNTADLTWSAASDPDGDAVTYTVMLDDEEIADDITDTEYTIEDLQFSHKYSGKIIAADEQGETNEALFDFTTEDPGPDGTVFISGSWFYELDLSTGKVLDSTDRKYSTLAIDNGVMYRTSENTVEAISLDDRSELWHQEFVKDADFETQLSDPVVIDDAVYFSSSVLDLKTFNSTFNLYRFDKLTGDKIWSKPTPNVITPVLMIKDRLMTIEQGEPGFKSTTYLSSRKPKSGELADSVLLAKRIASGSLIASDEALFTLDWEGVASSFDASASENWVTTVSKEALVSSSLFYKDMLFFNSRDGKTYGLDLASGAVSWETNTTSTGEYGSGIDIYENSLIIAGFSFVKRVDVATKEEMWSYKFELPADASSEGFGSLLTINDFVLFTVPYTFNEEEDKTVIVLLSAKDGTLLWSTMISTEDLSTTVTSGDKVYYDNYSYMQ